MMKTFHKKDTIKLLILLYIIYGIVLIILQLTT